MRLTPTLRAATDVAGRRPAATRLGFAVLMVLVPAAVLWVRQTPNALMGVGSFGGAVLEVGIYAAPGVLLYMWKAKTGGLIVGEGLVLLGLFSWVWWGIAVEGGSTAGIAPFVVGWMYAPVIIVSVAIVRAWREVQKPPF